MYTWGCEGTLMKSREQLDFRGRQQLTTFAPLVEGCGANECIQV